MIRVLVPAVLVLAPAAATAGGPDPSELEPALIWSHASLGLEWQAYHLGIGNRGTQVFAHIEGDDPVWLLLSSHDLDPPVPVWADDASPERAKDADSAEETDVHVSISSEDVTPNERTVRVRRFSSQGLDWTYTYPHLTAGLFHVGVSDDGERTVAAVTHPGTDDIELLVFGADSPVPTDTWTLPPGALWAFDLSDDGRRAGLAVGSNNYVVDVDSGDVLLAFEDGFAFNASVDVALSHDGSVFAAGGNSSRFRVWEWSGTEYQTVVERTTEQEGTVSAIAISDDNSTIAYGLSCYIFGGPGTTAHTECIDLPTRTVTMTETLESFGLWPNEALDVEIAADGSWFVVAQAGEQPQLWEEVRFFEKYSDTPVTTFPVNGSAMNVELSRDETWLAISTKHVHSSKKEEGGEVLLYRLFPVDFRLTTTPSVGSTVDLELRGAPGAVALALFSASALATPLSLPGLGVLHLDPTGLDSFALGTVDPAGVAEAAVTLPASAAWVGLSVYLQGLTLAPAALTEDWIALTLLPMPS